MKKIVYILYAIIFCYSCDKQPDENIDIEDDPEFEIEAPALGTLRKIVSGYIATDIAFDSKGNAWIGTFKQGIIRYNSQETVFFNSKNSIIPEGFSTNNIAIDKNIWLFGISECGLLIGNHFEEIVDFNGDYYGGGVWSMKEDSDYRIWFGTEDGIYISEKDPLNH